jgi:hypothetical protein
MNEVHQLASALLTIVFAAVMISKTGRREFRPSRRSSVHAMDKPAVKSWVKQSGSSILVRMHPDMGRDLALQ